MFGARPAAGGGFGGGGGGFASEGAGRGSVGGSSFAEPSFDDAYDAEVSMLRGGLGGGTSPEAQALSRFSAQAAHAAQDAAGKEAGIDARTQELVGVIRRVDLLERKHFISADLAAKLRKGALGDNLQQALVMLHHCYPESLPEGDAILGQYG